MISILLASLALSTTAVDVSTLVARVQATYDSQSDVSAEFSQSYLDSLRGTTREESGRLWAKKDGRVRWTYMKPVRKDFVYTGTAAYFYEPESAQVTVFEDFQESQLSQALRFLWGQGDLRESFEVQGCETECKRGNASQQVLVLWPKMSVATVDKILLVVDTATATVVRSVVIDPLGNETKYTLSNFDKTKVVEERLFDFQIPEGVSVLKASGKKPPQK
jgi:outer membrane lipoprotein carrier protein